MIVVPLALYFANQGPGPVIVPPTTTASQPLASGAAHEPDAGSATSQPVSPSAVSPS